MIRAGTRSARHRPYPERNGQPRQWVEIFIALLRSSRNGIAQIKPIYPNKGKAPHERLTLRAFCRGLPFGIRRFKPILPFLGGRSDAACRIVVKRMLEEHFNQALAVLGGAFFLCGGLRGVFFAPGGSMRAAGLLGVGLRVRLPQRPCAGRCGGQA